MGDLSWDGTNGCQLCAGQSLYEVTGGIYQVRGLDSSNMTIVEGDTGVIVIDPLVNVDTAAAAIGLYRAHRGDRPVTAVIHTHSHGEFFGGVAGVTDGDVPILAPVGFMEHGTVSLFPPTVDITHTGQEETLDGVRITFQLTPGTDAPSEMNLLFPERRALCMADILTLRGGQVRDARIWSRYLTEAITLFDDRVDVMFASHRRPTWGRENIMRYLSEQRDAHAYLHDQTLRLLSKGYTGVEIAEMIQLPPALERAWHARGYHGSVSHNVKAIYQRYVGWFDGNPGNLWQHPPVDRAKRYVDCFGGLDNVVAKAGEFAAAGDLRFAAQLLQHAVFADPDSSARELLAQVYERLGHGAENGTWRDFYLSGAQELRHGIKVTPIDLGTGMAAALSIEQIFDALAIRIDAPNAWHDTITIDWRFTDLDEFYRTTLRNGALIHHRHQLAGRADLRLTLTKAELLGMLAGKGLNGIAYDGDPDALNRLLSHLDEPDPNFAIATP